MKTTVKKTFLDICKEEEWLNEQGESGLMLIGYGNGNYEFEDVSPAKYQYKIDIPNYRGNKKKEYLNFLEQSGITIVAEYAGRVYMRKNKANGPLELYTDSNEINKQVRKKFSMFISIGVSQFAFGIMLLISMLKYIKEKNAPFWITAIFGSCFVICGIVFFIMGILKQRKNTIKKEKVDIFEE